MIILTCAVIAEQPWPWMFYGGYWQWNMNNKLRGRMGNELICDNLGDVGTGDGKADFIFRRHFSYSIPIN